MNETHPNAILSFKPSRKSVSVSIMASIVISIVLWVAAPHLVQKIYMVFPNLPWTVKILLGLQWAIKILCLIGIFFNLVNYIKLWSIKYEITPDRFLYHHGILVRKHDEIELQRIRDYTIYRPLMSRALGLGMIKMSSSDEFFPLLNIGPFDDARAIQQSIRDAAEVRKSQIGYREFESL